MVRNIVHVAGEEITVAVEGVSGPSDFTRLLKSGTGRRALVANAVKIHASETCELATVTKAKRSSFFSTGRRRVVTIILAIVEGDRPIDTAEVPVKA